jgi:hypothetical protein
MEKEERITLSQGEVTYFREGDLVLVKHAGRDMFIPVMVFVKAIHDMALSMSPLGHTHDYSSLSGLPTIPAGQVQSDWAQANIAAVDFVKNKPAVRSQSVATRSLNAAFQISDTRDTLVSYSVDISTSLSLTAGQQGTVFLEIANDAAFTTGMQELARFVNGNTGTLTIGLALNQNVTGALVGYVPAGKYARLRTQNNVGAPTFNYRAGQEALL